MYHLKTQADIEIWAKAEGDGNHSLPKRQLLFCPDQTQPQVVKLFSSFSRLLYRMNGLSVLWHCSFISTPPLFFLVSQCAAVPQWTWRSSRWTRRLWWWAGNALWPSTTRPSPATWSPTAGWSATSLTRTHSPKLRTREQWVSQDASKEADKATVVTPTHPRSLFQIGFKQFPFFWGNLRCMWQDQKVAGSVTVCRGGDRLWWTLLVAVGWYEGPDTPLSLTCLRIDT